MNRRERRKLQEQGVQVPKDPSINIKLSDLGRGIMTPAMESAMMHEINQQCLEADARFSLDLDTMVLWTLYQCYGWREKRLHDFYLAMAREHRRMREYYQMDDLYPERYKLKEKGIAPGHIEGYNSNSWILLDYGSVIVHVFTPEAHDFYDLEHLWADAKELPAEEWEEKPEEQA